MVKRDFFMNSFIAFSLDNYNKKEHIIYCIGHANEFFADKTKNIFAETREIGELAIDFSSNNDNYGAEERQNLIFDYLSEYKRFVEINAHQWNCDDEQIERRKAMTEMIDILNNSILSDSFFDAQKHLSLNERHRLSSFELLKKYYPEKSAHINSDLMLFYIDDVPYIATDFNFIGLLRCYLDELYGAGMFPRSCMSCGKVFLSGKKHGDVLCSSECRKKKKSQNTMIYYGKLSENETLYNSLYRKWKQRIDRAEENHTIDEKGIAELRQELKELTYINRTRANERKKGNVPEKDGVPDYESFDKLYHDVLMSKDAFLYTLFNSLKKD